MNKVQEIEDLKTKMFLNPIAYKKISLTWLLFYGEIGHRLIIYDKNFTVIEADFKNALKEKEIVIENNILENVCDRILAAEQKWDKFTEEEKKQYKPTLDKLLYIRRMIASGLAVIEMIEERVS